MEEYRIINSNENNIKFGKFFNIVNKKHIESYGEQGADNIVENIGETYGKILQQLHDNKKNNNVLLVGKVQSGKTSNLELLTALAFDNGYNVLVIYGGYDTSLLRQTTERFKKTFNATGEITYDDACPAVFTTDDSNQILSIDDEIMADLLDCGKPIIFVSMKRPVAMKKINALFKRIQTKKIKAFIIDDEGDQASLNTAKDKENKASATYAQIKEMKKLLSNPMYLSVTATPQANIFLNELSELRPDSIRLIQPGKGYQGADVYHLYENSIVETDIILEEKEEMFDGNMPQSLWDAIRYFIVASAIKGKLTGDKYSDMIIHAFREVNQHSSIYTSVESFMKDMSNSFSLNDEDVFYYYREFEACYNTYIDYEIKEKICFNDIKDDIKEVIKRTHVILKNSAGKSTQGVESLKRHKIYIGGDLLQRGLTFKNLITTYFTRWAAGGGNMDTNLQRARWFGYRQKYINLCKIFTTYDIAQEFTALAEIEDDLWDQFSDIEAGSLEIDDILIRSDNTRQSPTSKTRVDYKKVSFKNRWIKQRYLLLEDLDKCVKNNEIIKKLLSNLSWKDTSVASTNNCKTAHYSYVSNGELKALISLINEIFDYEPFQKKALLDLVGQEDIPVILMTGNCDNYLEENSWLRHRSLYKNTNRIKALQQGADKSDIEQMTYKGDSSVIVDEDKINIQIHYVEPQYKGEKILSDFRQFMFAVYVPKNKVYFIKEN